MKRFSKLFKVLLVAVLLIIPSMYLLVGCEDDPNKGNMSGQAGSGDQAGIETSFDYGKYTYKAQMVLNTLNNTKDYDYSMSINNVDYIQLNQDATIEIYNGNGGTTALVEYNFSITEDGELFIEYAEEAPEKSGYIDNGYLYILARVDENQELYFVYEFQSDEQSDSISIEEGYYYSIGTFVKDIEQNTSSFTYNYDESYYLLVEDDAIVFHNGYDNSDSKLYYEIVANRDIIIIGEDSAQTYVAGYVKGSQIYFLMRVLDVNEYEYLVYQFPINNWLVKKFK